LPYPAGYDFPLPFGCRPSLLGRPGRDRNAARLPSLGFGGCSIGFPMALSPTPITATFPQAPLRSRTVGFPESGSDLGCPPTAFPNLVKLKCWLIFTPPALGLPVSLGRLSEQSAPGSVSRLSPRPAKCPEPLCTPRVLPPASCRLHRTSAGVTPPSSLLRAHAPIRNPPAASGFPRSAGLCRLLPAPAGSRTFPTLSLPIFRRMSGPLRRLPPGCAHPFLPPEHWPSPNGNWVGASLRSRQRLPSGCPFRRCRHLLMFRPAALLATLAAPTLTPFDAGQP
jgi:hypothetical protein